ncbi:MAG: peptide chain release factor N(5)-glutamine methyltransferase [Pseudobutyrivibrio sp.]|nr:peptide chain release factor N(5)-glutamine methyltransferase [Pseudobutyrivibrio sp.]
MKYSEALKFGQSLLEGKNIADAKFDAWYLLSHVSGMTRSDYILKGEDQMPEAEMNKYRAVLEKRADHTPLQYITGDQDFMGLTFLVNENVLIPRQDTEDLVEHAIKCCPEGARVLDLCTGSGCVIISLVAKKEGVSGLGTDISEKALEVAKVNAARLAPGRVDFVWGDMFEPVDGKFDMILSNPPYIPSEVVDGLEPEVKDHEPRLALDGTQDGLFFYRTITSQAPAYLKEGGCLMVEIGYDQGEDVADLFTSAGFKNVEVIKDLAKNDRIVKGNL